MSCKCSFSFLDFADILFWKRRVVEERVARGSGSGGEDGVSGTGFLILDRE